MFARPIPDIGIEEMDRKIQEKEARRKQEEADRKTAERLLERELAPTLADRVQPTLKDYVEQGPQRERPYYKGPPYEDKTRQKTLEDKTALKGEA